MIHRHPNVTTPVMERPSMLKSIKVMNGEGSRCMLRTCSRTMHARGCGASNPKVILKTQVTHGCLPKRGHAVTLGRRFRVYHYQGLDAEPYI